VSRVAIVGTGNIGSDLLEKVRRPPRLEPALFAGIDPDSPGIMGGQEDMIIEVALRLSQRAGATSSVP
jgi:acetaldehyde dehydrogenase (acetylating)